jgi:hypothetical protein
MNGSGTNGLHLKANKATSSVSRRVLARPSVIGRQTVATRVDWQPWEAAKPGEVLTAKSPPPARHSVESSRQLLPVSGGEGPKTAGRLRRAGQDREGHGTPRARLDVGSSGVVLCPFSTGLTKELIATRTDLRVTPHRASNTARPVPNHLNPKSDAFQKISAPPSATPSLEVDPA